MLFFHKRCDLWQLMQNQNQRKQGICKSRDHISLGEEVPWGKTGTSQASRKVPGTLQWPQRLCKEAGKLIPSYKFKKKKEALMYR